MTEHISAGQLEKLGSYEVYGQELLKCLEHLEACRECRGRVRKPTDKEVIRRLLSNETESETDKVEVGGVQVNQ